jgi:diphosphomevalonate decarboxylase
MSLRIVARAPANIAIVKYMGKADAKLNLPANSSLSMTLDRLCTVVELVEAGSQDRWIPELPRAALEGLLVPDLDSAGVQKFLNHLNRVKADAPTIFRQWGIESRSVGNLQVRSANTFPAASGIASSASAFAALTLAGAAGCARNVEAFQEAWKKEPSLRRSLAQVSRQGSGSSCRSFEGPWVMWQKDEAFQVPSSLDGYVDLVLLVASGKKAVSSSNAHLAVQQSPLWHGRTQRADRRVQMLRAALESGNSIELARIAWQELWEMHSLFHTSPEPFSYWLPVSLEILQWLKPTVEQGLTQGSSQTPVVTMDAGPNVHLLVPQESATDWITQVKQRFPGLEVLKDGCGLGAQIMSIF